MDCILLIQSVHFHVYQWPEQLLSHACHMSCQSHPLSFSHPNDLINSMEQVDLEKLTGPQLMMKFPHFVERKRSVQYSQQPKPTIFWAGSIWSVTHSQFLKIHFNIIFPSTPMSSKWSISFRFPHQNPLCTTPLPTQYMLNSLPISFWIWSPEKYSVWSNAPHYAVFSIILLCHPS